MNDRKFILSMQFDQAWCELGLTDLDLTILQNRLLANPQCGDVIPGAGGLRKIRISLPGRGKRGGGRVLYVDFVIIETIFLLDVYSKNESENITESDKREYRNLIKAIENEARRKR